jgi:serine/threonine protein kinase
MSDAAFCKRCGTSMSADTAQGLCPACLLEQGLGGAGGAAAGYASVDETAAMPGGGGARAGGPGTANGGTLQPGDLARLFPQLEILDLLGRGGMGVVYKARQRGLDRLVALKVLPPGVDRDPGFQERFVREARALARMSHPNIVAVHDFGQVEGQYYFLMEYVDGVNLRRMLQSGNLSPGEALGIVPQVCDALQYAHEEGIVHRDIKPENILLDRRGRVKIADFGLAKILTGGSASPERGYTLTASQAVMGTPHYMAPEQFERPNTVDHRADIYSLGVVFYEMLTGELPLGRFPPPSRMVQVDVRLDEVVLRTLEKEPRQRYQRAGDVKTELASFASARTSDGVGHGPPRRRSGARPPRPPRRSAAHRHCPSRHCRSGRRASRARRSGARSGPCCSSSRCFA